MWGWLRKIGRAMFTPPAGVELGMAIAAKVDPKEVTAERARMDIESIKADGKQFGADLLALIKKRTGDFLDNNRQAKDFVTDRTLRVGTLIMELKWATTDSVRQEKTDRIELVESTIDVELKGLMLEGSTEAKAVFKEVVQATFTFAAKLLPVVLKAL